MLVDDYFLATKRYHQQLATLFKPLADYLGLSKAWYVQVNKQGQAVVVTTDVAWMEHSITQQYYNVDISLVHPSKIRSGFALPATNPNKEFITTCVKDIIVNFNWHYPFGYAQKTAQGYWWVGLAADEKNVYLLERLLNEKSIIKKAIQHLQQQITLILGDTLADHVIDAQTLKGEANYHQQGMVWNDTTLLKQSALLTNMGVLQAQDNRAFLNDNLKLSHQEINCLREYLDTDSVKKVSRNLKLANTTVANYLKNVKDKLECHTKNELLSKAEILQSLGRL